MVDKEFVGWWTLVHLLRGAEKINLVIKKIFENYSFLGRKKLVWIAFYLEEMTNKPR